MRREVSTAALARETSSLQAVLARAAPVARARNTGPSLCVGGTAAKRRGWRMSHWQFDASKTRCGEQWIIRTLDSKLKKKWFSSLFWEQLRSQGVGCCTIDEIAE
jgi:hypothetical protein